ncbi:MAG: penicillin acylase family protein, partial [archaeon]|nr:penicillin acylase family protein [archaeon]
MFPAEDESTPILPFVVGFIILLLLAGGIWFLFFAQPPIPPPPECEEDWECSGWSACVNGIQTRVCIDQNACGTIDDKPPVQQSCVSPPVCGNQICEAGENSTNCPADCGTIPPFCGDNACQSSEDCFTCPQDCGTCQPFCGDSVCDATETCSTCESDCGVCECTENWFCTDWGPCTNGTQTRSCTDLNACGTQVDQPLLSQTCGIDLKIIRDQFGVPHVFATTDYSAFYGMGYATAQDRIYQMHRTRMIMKGRLSELNGSMGGGATINLDIKMRRLQFADYAAARYPNLDAETKDFLQAYSDGVNYYLETHKTSLLYLFDSVPEPWTPVDSLLVWDSVVRAGVDATEVTNRRTFDQKVAQLGSADAAAADMEPTAYVDSDGAVVQQSDVPAATLQAMQTYANQHSPFGGYSTNLIEVPKMSHAWVVGGSRSTTGAAILVSSPQLDVTSPSPWHEIHVKGATFDVRGAAIPGAPGIYVGFNPRVAWGITAAGGDLSDVFKLKMVGTDQYEYNGQTYTIESRNETILVKNGNPQSITVKKTILGPIITPMVSALPGEEYIVQAVPLVDSDIHTIQSLIAMMRADDVYQFRDALAKYRSPAVHIIFGDSQGNIGYWHLAAVPTRSSLSPLAGMVAQDGSHSQYLWQGFIPHTLRPHVINPSSGI